MMKETGKINAYLSITLLLAVIILSSNIAHAKKSTELSFYEGNPTEWPYGGEPDVSRMKWYINGTPVIFKQKVDFSYAQFSTVAFFWNAQFSKEANFWSAQFLKGADFWNAHFSKEANFNSAQFSKRARFLGVKFLEEADFSATLFSNKANFNSALFSKRARFLGVKFLEEADFSVALFSNKANFNSALFSNKADFNSAQFSKRAQFLGVKFLEEADFSAALFSKEPDFENAVIGTTFNIAGTRFEEGVDLRRTNLSKAIVLFNHHTFFPPGTLQVYWSQLEGYLSLSDGSCPSSRIRESVKRKVKMLDSYWQHIPDPLIAKRDSIDIELSKAKADFDSLTILLNKEQYDLTEIFYHRLRDNYLSQNDRASADGVMYELASKRAEYLKEPLWKLYGLFMGWGYKPLRFVLTVFLFVVLPFSYLWYKRFYHRVAPLVAPLNEEQKSRLNNPSAIQHKTFLKIFKCKTYNHHEASCVANLFARLWHVVHFSASVLFSIRFNKSWIEMEDRTFLTWVTAEWALGIGLYVTFAILVKSYEFGYVKGLLGF